MNIYRHDVLVFLHELEGYVSHYSNVPADVVNKVRAIICQIENLPESPPTQTGSSRRTIVRPTCQAYNATLRPGVMCGAMATHTERFPGDGLEYVARLPFYFCTSCAAKQKRWTADGICFVD